LEAFGTGRAGAIDGTTSEETPMTHDSHDGHAHEPSQGVFIGGLAIGLLALMAVFTLFVLAAGFR
jgi:hypothetical protein